MSQMIVKHKVSDYENWKRLFDSANVVRKIYGEKGCTIFRNPDDPNDLAILFQWDNLKKAMKYAQFNELRSAMKLAGVEGEPILYLLDEELKA